MNDTKTLSIVLASYNQLPYLKQTVESVLANTHHPFELVVVDNGSEQETLDYIDGLSSTDKVTIKKLKSDPNQFVTHTWNVGIKAATGDYIAVINNDIVVSKDWDTYLINALQDPEVWLANPYQLDDSVIEPYARTVRDGNIDIRGACFMFRKDLFPTIGYLPEQL